MDLTFHVTPEMVGLNWRRVLRFGLTTIPTAVLVGALLSKFFQGRFITGSIVGAVLSMVVCTLLLRPLTRTKVRVTDDIIEQLDGPVIRR